MSKYFKNINSLEQLKNNYKELLKANHPDNGGDLETMQDINCEYDALFAIWKRKEASTLTEEQQKETGASTRAHFYSAYGWAGSRYNSNLTLKEISKIVKNYTKEQYPTCKFSVRTKYASMCQELIVSIKEFPAKMYKTGDDLRKEKIDYNDSEISLVLRRMSANDIFTLTCWNDDEFITAYEKALDLRPDFYGIPTEYFKSVIEDVDAFVNSYNYDDSDSMTDYFDVNFYYFGCGCSDCKVVEKTARIKNQSAEVTEGQPAEETAEPEQNQDEPQENILDSYFRKYGSPSEFAEHTLHLYSHRASGLHTEADILREMKRADDFIKDMQHYIECLKAHQAELVQQYNFIATSPTKNKIRLERRKNSWTNKVNYHIIYFTVNLNDYSETESGRESFEGKDRKKALDRFAELEAAHPDYILEKDIEKARWER